MGKIFKWAGLALLIYLIYLLTWPTPIDPVSWQATANAGYVGDFAKNKRLKALKFYDLGGHVGPEDAAFSEDGMIYAATHDGDILKLDPASGKFSVFANTGGRPLGIEFGNGGVLYVADAYRGLLAITKEGTVSVLADKTDSGSPIKYADDVDVTKSGEIYFSDASTKFGAKQYSPLQAGMYDIMEHGPNGRILKYDPETGNVTVVAAGYSFANGVAMAMDDSYLLFVEMGTYSIQKLWLDGDKEGQVEAIIANLPGFPDNINKNPDGSFWIGLMSQRSPIVDMLSDKPFIRQVIQRLPAAISPKPQRYGFVVRINGEGKVLETLQDPAGAYAITTGAVDGPDGSVVVTSLVEKRLGVLAAR